MKNNRYLNPFYSDLISEIIRHGGMYNAHLHLDRANTLDDKYMQSSRHHILENSYISLHKKHSLINSLHAGPAYEKDDFRSRVNATLDVMIASNTKRADTMVDVTADNIGTKAIQMLEEIKKEREQDIDLHLAAYSPFGFTDAEPQRWEKFIEGVEFSDFIGALPEADDTDEYPDHIGFEEHCKRMLMLAKQYNKVLHVHTDQRNEPSENGTERLIEVVKSYGAPVSASGEPMVWAVHMISPSTYEDERFEQLARDLVECNIGVICCPSAAIGMRQIRPITTPTYNSIPRVLELLREGVHVRLASDNIADICSPSTTADLIDEVYMLSAAIRFYHVGILAKLAAGVSLDTNDIKTIDEHLEKNKQEMNKIMADYSKRIRT
ncbi:MAG: hypothetical protein RLT87_12645 [Gammaproteobacteria bacterium]